MKDLPPEIYNAVITANGKLTKKFKYIQELREINEKELTQKQKFHEEQFGDKEATNKDDGYAG